MKSKKLFLIQKRRELIPFFVFILLFPYIVGFSPDSTSSYSEMRIGAGTGQYVYHDCSGAHSQKFSDLGIYIGKKYEGPYRLGLGVGAWSAGKNRSGALLFPDLALDWEQFSIGTTGIRLGSQNNFYIEAKSLDQPPFFSGKGLFRLGAGVRIKENDSRFWIGSNFFPYTNPGIALQYEFPYEKDKYIFINGRLGNDKESGLSEYGISIGMRMISF